MKSKFFYGVLAVLSLTACSQDEVLDVNRSGDEIKFSVVTNKATRAVELYNNSELPTTMKVWGNLSSNGVAYFSGDDVTIASNGTCTYTDKRYWPAEELDFFAVAGRSDNSLTVSRHAGATKTSASFAYTVVGDTEDNTTFVNNQEDVLYAAALNTSKPDDGTGKVTLNFAHALSQIVFKAKNTNPNLHVFISGVKVAHLNNQGTFTFDKSTDKNFDNEASGNSDNADDNTNNSAGDWKNTSGDKTYEITFDDVEVGYSTSEVKDLTGTGAGNVMLLMPQNTTKWTSSSTTGTFFAVKCRIYNVTGDAYDEDNDVQLWGAKGENKAFNEDEAYVYIPADISWSDGKKYIYTFNFGDGNGGFEPNPDKPNEPDPDNPVLVGITYEVTVDDFDIISDKTVDVDGK